MRRLFLYILLLLVLTLKSQDISKDFSLVNNYIAKTERLSININISVKDNISNKIIQTQKGYYKKIKNLYTNKLNDKLVITDTGYVFLIDYTRKYIYISKARNVNITNKIVSPEFIKKMITICDTVIFHVINKDIVKYTMSFSRTYKEISIILNLQKKQILQFQIHNFPVLFEGKKVEYISTVNYSHYTTQVNKRDLSIYKYLQIHKSVLKPKPEYKSYKFVNMLN